MMRPYYDVLKTLIEKGSQTLRDLEWRIAYGVADGRLTQEEADDLKTRANAQSAPPDLPTGEESAIMLGEIKASLAMLAERVKTLEDKATSGTGEGGDTEEPTGSQPPAGVEVWVAGTAYMYGATVWHASKVWVSQQGNNRDEPGIVAWAWKAVA